MLETIQTAFQIIIPFGIFNVWFLRNRKSTNYRGNNAGNLKEEFEAYGLSESAFFAVGFFKIASAALLLVGFFIPVVVAPAAVVMAVLMVGAVLMHAKVKDPAIRYLPAGLMLAMSLVLIF